mmetsp:Transcript_75504/g.209787  ORF Transcript_75504/g.209787 Transcript_75504/m.209787 type:complete len:234 (-) Transcript_75504:694-1395(-)
MKLLRSVELEILCDDPWPAHQKLPRLPWADICAEVVGAGDAHLDARQGQARLGDVSEKRLGALREVLVLRDAPADTAQRIRFCHAPALQELHVEVFSVPAHHLGWWRRTAASQQAQPMLLSHCIQAHFLDGSAYTLPHRRHPCAQLHLPIQHQIQEGLRVHEPASEDHAGAEHEAHEGHAPTQHVEHRDKRAHSHRSGDTELVGGDSAERVEVCRPLAVSGAFRQAGRARCVT